MTRTFRDKPTFNGRPHNSKNVPMMLTVAANQVNKGALRQYPVSVQ